MLEEKRLHQQTTQNVQTQANMIWNIANILRGAYKAHEYGKVILPMTIIKRFHDTLLSTRDAVIEMSEKTETFAEEMRQKMLNKASGYDFYNISPFTFEILLSDPTHIEENFRSYLNGFSDNVQDVLSNFEFDKEISKLASENMLFSIIQEFNKQSSYLGPDKITSTDMGYIFEELVHKFSESYGEEAGEHFTSRDIIYLMTDLLLIDNQDELQGMDITKSVYDQTMGTSQMLSAMTERIHQFNKDVDVITYGQELNGETFAIAKADTMIRGGNANNMKKGNTLSNDKFPDYTFDYCISNPPFGVDWKTAKAAVTEEHEMGAAGRFAPGLPKISDGQLLFQLNGLSKLKETGRMAIIHNGSALFSGNAGGGESAIRQYVIENDWLEAIIQLPNDLFYNTGIATYIWILTKNKSEARKGKVQLIDASNCFEKRRKNIGNKRVDITTPCRDLIVKAYQNFSDEMLEYQNLSVESKVCDNLSFGYTKVTIESPLKGEDGQIVTDKKGNPKADKTLKDTEDIPLTENIDEYFEREVKPFNEDAWMDRKKDKIGYEIPFTRLFYKYEALESSEVIAKRIQELESKIQANFNALLSGGQDND